MSRHVFVTVATEEFGIRGRPTNVSRVALLTGLARRDVRRLRDSDSTATGRAVDESLNHASRVLTGWHLDPDFLDEHGEPKDLPARGPSPSFEVLLKRYAGDIPVTALVKELIRSGSIKRLSEGRFRALRRFYMPRASDDQAVERAGSVLADLVDTVEFNLSRKPRQPSRFEGRAQNRQIDPSNLPAFRAFVEREGQGFLERVDDWLSSHETPSAAGSNSAIRLGVGVYAIHGTPPGEKS